MAADFTAEIGRAAGHLEASWSPERAGAVLRGMHGRKKRRGQRRVVGAVAAVLALALLSPQLIASLRRGAAGLASVAKVAAPPTGTELAVSALPLRLRDGSLVRPQGSGSQVRLREDRPGRTVVELVGAAEFEVVHDPRRLFRVETHGLAVEVLGTRFLVEEQGPKVRVVVQQGRVRVLWASHYDELGAGQSAVFQPEPADVAGPAAAAPLPPLGEPAPPEVAPKVQAGMSASAHTAPPRSRSRRSTPPSEPAAPLTAPVAVVAASAAPPPASEPASWQTLAHEGLFEQAYRLAYGAPEPAAHHLAEPPLLREREVAPSELLLLADVARLSHHPADAMAPLSRLLREHAADPRAPLAAFTLGRVLLDDLGRPREAAESFVRVQQLDPDGPLSQDALAREVEAWSRAGEAASARTRALQYVQKYPAGRRLRSVRHFGELL